MREDLPWVRLYRKESSSFALLPLYTRGLAAELLKVVDLDGRIPRAGRPAWEVVARRLGATSGDRRRIAADLDLLSDAEYLVITDEAIEILNFAQYQPASRSRTSTPPPQPESQDVRTRRELSRTRHENDANFPEHDATFRERDARFLEIEAKSAEPLIGTDSALKKELELEEELELDLREDAVEPSAAAGAAASLVAEIRSCESRYEPSLVREARDACGLRRRNGKIADSVWLRTLQKLATHPVDAVQYAMRQMSERYADGDKDERYMLVIARNAANKRGSPAGLRPTLALLPPAPHTAFPERTEEEFQEHLKEVFGG